MTPVTLLFVCLVVHLNITVKTLEIVSNARSLNNRIPNTFRIFELLYSPSFTNRGGDLSRKNAPIDMLFCVEFRFGRCIYHVTLAGPETTNFTEYEI